MKTEVLLIRNIPAKVKKDFKANCAQRGITMQYALVELMKYFSGARVYNFGNRPMKPSKKAKTKTVHAPRRGMIKT